MLQPVVAKPAQLAAGKRHAAEGLRLPTGTKSLPPALQLLII